MIGNIVGSNICNILFVLGLPALFVPLLLDRKGVRNDILIMIGSAILLLIFALLFGHNGEFGLVFFEGVILLLGIILYVVYNIRCAKKAQRELACVKTSNFDLFGDEETKTDVVEIKEIEPKQSSILKILLMVGVGLLAILLGGDLVTYSASNVASKLGISEVLIGLTIVAVCTSLPELVTSLVAARKKENDIAIGNVVGSNIFNILFILGLSSMITPIHINSVVIIDILIVIGLSVFILGLYKFKGKISFKMGVFMLGLYALYVASLILREVGIL